MCAVVCDVALIMEHAVVRAVVCVHLYMLQSRCDTRYGHGKVHAAAYAAVNAKYMLRYTSRFTLW